MPDLGLGSTVLDAGGGGSVILQPGNAHESWDVGTVVVNVTPAVKTPTARILVSGTEVANTYSGAQNTCSGEPTIHVGEGQYLQITWSGGDPGARATATITGTRNQRR